MFSLPKFLPNHLHLPTYSTLFFIFLEQTTETPLPHKMETKINKPKTNKIKQQQQQQNAQAKQNETKSLQKVCFVLT